MKKTLLIVGLITMSAIGSYAQGLVSIQLTAQSVSTNGPATGRVTGINQYDFELLTSTSLSMGGNTNLLNYATLALWTDTGVSGVNGTGVNAGKLTSGGSVATAANTWASPGPSYDNLQSAIIVGYSASLGSWANVVADIQAGGAALGGFYFGETTVSQDYAGGGASTLPAVNIWANTTPQSLVLNLVVVPEPTTIALASLGGMALLAFRRRKA